MRDMLLCTLQAALKRSTLIAALQSDHSAN